MHREPTSFAENSDGATPVDTCNPVHLYVIFCGKKERGELFLDLGRK
jgi:hypothetical protein